MKHLFIFIFIISTTKSYAISAGGGARFIESEAKTLAYTTSNHFPGEFKMGNSHAIATGKKTIIRISCNGGNSIESMICSNTNDDFVLISNREYSQPMWHGNGSFETAECVYVSEKPYDQVDQSNVKITIKCAE